MYDKTYTLQIRGFYTTTLLKLLLYLLTISRLLLPWPLIDHRSSTMNLSLTEFKKPKRGKYIEVS